MEQKNDVTTIYSRFPILLQERCHKKRQTWSGLLAPYSNELMMMLAMTNEDPYLKDMVTEKIGNILSDCEVFHGMDTRNAMDAMGELSNWAALYVGDDKYSHIYLRICELIRLIRVSYPLSF